MRRLVRLAYNFSAVASALLLVAVCVLWVRSYWRADYADRESAGRSWGVTSWRGRLIVDRDDSPAAAGAGRWEASSADADWYVASLWAAETGSSQFGRSADRFALRRGTAVIRRWWAPHWSLAVAAWVLPAVSVFRQRLWNRGRAKTGHCPACGYDLRATPEEGGALLGRCPECGAVPKRA